MVPYFVLRATIVLDNTRWLHLTTKAVESPKLDDSNLNLRDKFACNNWTILVKGTSNLFNTYAYCILANDTQSFRVFEKFTGSIVFFRQFECCLILLLLFQSFHNIVNLGKKSKLWKMSTEPGTMSIVEIVSENIMIFSIYLAYFIIGGLLVLSNSR